MLRATGYSSPGGALHISRAHQSHRPSVDSTPCHWSAWWPCRYFAPQGSAGRLWSLLEKSKPTLATWLWGGVGGEGRLAWLAEEGKGGGSILECDRNISKRPSFQPKVAGTPRIGRIIFYPQWKRHLVGTLDPMIEKSSHIYAQRNCFSLSHPTQATHTHSCARHTHMRAHRPQALLRTHQTSPG